MSMSDPQSIPAVKLEDRSSSSQQVDEVCLSMNPEKDVQRDEKLPRAERLLRRHMKGWGIAILIAVALILSIAMALTSGLIRNRSFESFANSSTSNATSCLQYRGNEFASNDVNDNDYEGMLWSLNQLEEGNYSGCLRFLNYSKSMYVWGSYDVRAHCIKNVYIQMVYFLEALVNFGATDGEALGEAFVKLDNIREIMNDVDAKTYELDDDGLNEGRLTTVLNYTTVLFRDLANYVACSQSVSKHSAHRFRKTIGWVKAIEKVE
jgi:hypothetical protein